MNKPPNLREVKERLRARLLDVFTQTEKNVLSGRFIPPQPDEAAKRDMCLVELAFYNSLTGEKLTWDDAKQRRNINKKALTEAKRMMQDFVNECFQEGAKSTVKRFRGWFNR